jgi:hypothetical protein
MPGGNMNAGLVTSREHVWGFWGTGREGHIYSGDSLVLYVNPNHPGAADGVAGAGNTGEDPNYPFATIAAALARCRDCRGDTIYVGDNDGWTYGGGGGAVNRVPIREEITVDVEGVRIIGVSSGPLGVAWEPITAAGLGTCISVTALNVYIEGFAFIGGLLGGTGIHATWSGTTAFADNVVIRNCTFDSAIDTAINLEYVWYGEISGCKFVECDYGVYNDPALNPAAYCNIHHNWFHNVVTGAISLQKADYNHIHHNTVYNANAQGAALATDEGIDTSAGLSNMVVENWFSCVLPAAANGDWDDLNSGAATDAWVGNICTNGMAVTTPT